LVSVSKRGGRLAARFLPRSQRFDIGTLASAGSSFGFGQMIESSDLQTTTVYLRYGVNNGYGHALCRPGEKPLYPIGLQVDPVISGKIVNGLRILGVSILTKIIRKNNQRG
jgi:hypothetical protein